MGAISATDSMGASGLVLAAAFAAIPFFYRRYRKQHPIVYTHTGNVAIALMVLFLAAAGIAGGASVVNEAPQIFGWDISRIRSRFSDSISIGRADAPLCSHRSPTSSICTGRRRMPMPTNPRDASPYPRQTGLRWNAFWAPKTPPARFAGTRMRRLWWAPATTGRVRP